MSTAIVEAVRLHGETVDFDGELVRAIVTMLSPGLARSWLAAGVVDTTARPMWTIWIPGEVSFALGTSVLVRGQQLSVRYVGPLRVWGEPLATRVLVG